MSEKRYVVPDGMFMESMLAVWASKPNGKPDISERVSAEIEAEFKTAITAAIRWLAENPITPTREQCQSMYASSNHPNGSWQETKLIALEWQRRMFLAPEPEVPESIRDLYESSSSQRWKEAILDAYRRGQMNAKSNLTQQAPRASVEPFWVDRRK
jgi:hypothetical protein